MTQLNGASALIGASVEPNYSALAASQLLTYINVNGGFSRSNGSSWGDGKLGGNSGHYVSGQFSAYQNAGYQSVYGHEGGGDYNSFWSPFGYAGSGDNYDVTVSDLVSPLMGPVALPVDTGPQLVLESPFESINYSGTNSSGFTLPDGTTSQSSGKADFSAWHSETDLGLRLGDGSVIPLATLNEAEGFNLSTTSSSMSFGPSGFSFTDVSASVSGFESSSNGPIQDAGLAGALDKTLSMLDQGASNPLGAVSGIMHGGTLFSPGSSGSVFDVALAHLNVGMKG